VIKESITIFRNKKPKT